MKRILILSAVFCSLVRLSAQGPYYLMFNLACMDQLEYRGTNSGVSNLSFLFRPTANDYYLLSGGGGGITAATLPRGVKDCRDVVLDEPLVESVNNLTKQMYIVQQTQQGYVLTPIIAITRISRSGTYYVFRANTHSFALDTTRLMYGANLASVGSPSAVYFTGLKDIYGCRFQYSFRREPSRANMEKSDFDFIPGVGIVSDRPGLTAAEANANEMRLWAINGRMLDDHLAALCGRQPGTSTAGVPQFTGYPAGAVTDKEEALINYGGGQGQGATTPTINPQTGLANCPEPPGRGYHIVQPGESLMAISRTYNVKVADLTAWNQIKNPNKIEVCQKIWLMKPPATATSTPRGVSAAPKTAPLPAGRTVANQSGFWEQPAAAVVRPVQHATPTTATAPAPTDYWGQIAGSSRPVLIHVVQKGETLSGLARKYGYTDERFRRMNAFPASGDYRLAEGQQIIVSDCEYDVNTPTPTNIISSPPGSTSLTPQSAPGGITPTTGAPATTTPITYSTPWSTTTAKAAAMTAPGTVPSNQFLESSVIDADKERRYAPPGTNPAGTLPQTYSAPTTTTPATPGNYAALREYTVQQGDTVRSIAIKFNVNETELAVTNNLAPNESLVPGKRLMIPRQ